MLQFQLSFLLRELSWLSYPNFLMSCALCNCPAYPSVRFLISLRPVWQEGKCLEDNYFLKAL